MNGKSRGNLTLNLGVRYEYVSPFTEENNRIANLDLSPAVLTQQPNLSTSAVAVVLPGQSGPFSGGLPASLVRPDRNIFAPRLGFAWKPFSKTVVRGGYGINYNTGAYQTIAQQLAFQPPFSTTETNIQIEHLQPDAGGRVFDLFRSPPEPTNNYAVNPNYRLGYVQTPYWTSNNKLRPTLLLNIDYTGTKGTDLDILEAPNRTVSPLGGFQILVPNIQAFTFESSVGDSEANAGSVRIRKRLATVSRSEEFTRFPNRLTMLRRLVRELTVGSGTRRPGRRWNRRRRWRRRRVLPRKRCQFRGAESRQIFPVSADFRVSIKRTS